MSKTHIECGDKRMLDGFCTAIKFFVEDAEVTRGKCLVTIETQDDWADVTYRLDKDGLHTVRQQR